MSKKKDTGHFGDAELNDLHLTVKNTTEGGACLTGHTGDFSGFKNKVSCNCRYQAYEQADLHGKSRSGCTATTNTRRSGASRPRPTGRTKAA